MLVFFRPHRYAACKMRFIVISVPWSACLLPITTVRPTKPDEPIKVALGL